MDGCDNDDARFSWRSTKPCSSSSLTVAAGRRFQDADSEASDEGEDIVYRYSRRQVPRGYQGVPGSVLVRGYRPRPPLRLVEELNLPPDLERAMKDFTDELSDFQGAVAPNFNRGSDLIVIAGDNGTVFGRHARFLSYLPPLVRVLHEVCGNMEASEFDTCSPDAVIVVNSIKVGNDFQTLLSNLLDNSGHITMKMRFLWKEIDMEGYSKRPEVAAKTVLPPGINVLILTLAYFTDMLKTAVGSRLFERLRFLVFEETESYIKKAKDDLIAIIKDIRSITERRMENKLFQITFSGSKWYHEFEDIYKCLASVRHAVIVIGALNQAIRFGKLEWNVHHIEEVDDKKEQYQAKIRKLMELLEMEVLKTNRVVVCCSSDDVAQCVYQSISDFPTFCYPVNVVHSSRSHDSMADSIKLWTIKQVDVMVLSDTMLKRFEICDADCLINFDSPNESMPKSTSADRFRCFWNSIRSIELEQVQGPKSQLLSTHFMMTGLEHNFYTMYRFSKSLETTVNIPDKLVFHAKKLEVQGVRHQPICSGILQSGFCNQPDVLLCSDRHEFSRKDFKIAPVTPLEGEIEVRIIKCMNPSFYEVQLLRHFEFVDGKRLCSESYVNELRRRDGILNEYFNQTSSAITMDDQDELKAQPRLLIKNSDFKKAESRTGWWCAVIHPEDQSYSRARFLSILESDKETRKVKHVRVYCVDKGVVLNPLAKYVYDLPRKFQQWPPLVVNLILCNLKPTRGELDYRPKDIKNASALTNGKTFLGKIWLAVGTTVWVKPLVEFFEDSNKKVITMGASVRMELIEREIAESNKDHLDILYELASHHDSRYKGRTLKKSCIEARNQYDEDLMKVKQEFHQRGDVIKWAFVDKSNENSLCPVKILTIFGYNPWIFYGVHDKFYDMLVQLEKELSQCIQNHINGPGNGKRSVRYKEIFSEDYFEPGMIVAAKDRGAQDGTSWVRAQIISITSRKDDSGKANTIFTLFNVDYGDVLEMAFDDIFPMPKRFVQRMPFQAIAFKLDYVEPSGGENVEGWSYQAKESFLDTIVPESGGIQLDLLALEDAGEDEENDSEEACIPCRYYKAVAFVNDVDLGSLLVQKGHAVWKPGQEEFISMWREKLRQFHNVVVDQAIEVNRLDHNVEIPVEDIEASLDENLEEWFSLLGLPPIRNGFKLPKFNVAGNEEGEDEMFFDAQDTDLPTPAVEQANPPMRAFSLCPSTSGPAQTVKTGDLHPTVLWHQTKTTVVLTVDLPDIQNFQVFVHSDRRTVSFQTLDRPMNYSFSLKLFGKISQEYETHLTGMALKITLKKKTEGIDWIRVLQDKHEKYSWLKSDLKSVNLEEQPSSEDESCEFLSSPLGFNDASLPYIVQDDDPKGYSDVEPDGVLSDGDDEAEAENLDDDKLDADFF